MTANEDVRRWQLALLSHGYEVGATDGAFGPATLRASLKALEGDIGGTNGSIKPSSHALKDPAAFFAQVRTEFGALTTPQVEGFNVLLKHMAAWDVDDTAYGLATAWHETNATMQPVAEAYFLGKNAEAWRKKNLRYWPWYGRGYPQTTWEPNYKRADDRLGLGGSLMKNPDRMLEPEVAAPTMVKGMEEGWFTGKKNSDYAPGEYVKRRAIINGTDEAQKVANYAYGFERALKAGGW